MNPTKLSASGETLLKSWEGFSLTAYKDSAGVPTIGWGHTRDVVMGQTITAEQAEDMFLADIAPTETIVSNSVHVALNQNEYDALVIFAFNVGDTAFENSTLLKTVNAKNFGAVPEQMAQWRYITVGGEKVVSQGLINRRAKEIALWSTPPACELPSIPSAIAPPTPAIAVPPALHVTDLKPIDAPVPIAPPSKVSQTRVGQSTLTAIFTGLSGAVLEGFNQAGQLVAGLHNAFDGTATGGQIVKLLATALAVSSIAAAVVAWYWKRRNLNGSAN